MTDYVLMNKNQIILYFSLENNNQIETFHEISVVNEKMKPFGFYSINNWLYQRKAFNHNQSLKELMKKLDCLSSDGFIKFTHATSIKDTYWIKEVNENLKWEDVSLFLNDFNETISKIAINGGLLGYKPGSTSPELAVGGTFRKCFKKEENGIFLYKIGNEGFFECKDEPYSEVIASEVANIICRKTVKYELSEIHGKPASKCKIFTNEKFGLVSAAELLETNTPDYQTIKEGIKAFGNEEILSDFYDMLVTDAIVFNEDRHADNFGFLYENDTKKIVSLAPIYDFNLSLFGNKKTDELKKIEDCIEKSSPNNIFGSDFLILGKNHLNEFNRKKIERLTHFSSKIKCSGTFTKEKKEILEKIVRLQSEGLLNQNIHSQEEIFNKTGPNPKNNPFKIN